MNEKKKQLAEERKKKKALQEYMAMNNIVSTEGIKLGRASKKKDDPVKVRKKRKRTKAYQSVKTQDAMTWRDWRQSDGKVSPVTTYNLKDESGRKDAGGSSTDKGLSERH